jgi:iduronate 2-sulfatase
VWNLHSYWRQEGGNFTTIPQYFKEQGYITKGIGKIFHWGPASGKLPLPASGLSAVYSPDNATRSLFRGEFDSDYSWTEEYFAPDGIHDDMDGDAMQPIPEKGPDGTKSKPLADELSLAHAVETLQQIQKARSEGTDSRAFFLAVGWIRPHLPYRFPERFLQYYDADKLELPPTWDKLPVGMPAQAYYKSSETREWKDIGDMEIDYRRYQNGTFLPDDLQGLFLGPVKTRQLRQGYYASISYVDWCVGQLLDEAKKVDGHDDAVVVFMSDHGYQLGEFGLWDKETNFAMATNAPFMIRVPGRTTRTGSSQTSSRRASTSSPPLWRQP